MIAELARIDVDADQPAAQLELQCVVEIGLAELGADREHHVGLGHQFLHTGMVQRGAEIGRMLVRQQTLAGRRRHQRAAERLHQRRNSAPASRAPPPATITGRDASASQLAAVASTPGGACGSWCGLCKALGGKIGRLRQHVERDLEIRGPRPAGAQRCEADPQVVAHVLGIGGAAGDAEHTGGERRLIGELVQHAPLLAERGAHRRGGHDQQRNGIRISLRSRGEDVGEPGTGDGERGRRAAGDAGIAVGGKARALLMAHEHMADVGGGESPIELEVVNPGNAEHRVDAVGGQQFDQIPTDAARHDSLLVERSVKNRARMAWAATKSKQARKLVQ